MIENTQVQFQDFSLTQQLLQAVEEVGYTTPTAIQAQAIPLLLNGQDVIGYSGTGTGKTAAFGLPAIESVDGTASHAQVLVLSPTRELAMQTAIELRKFSKYKQGISIATVYGGAPMVEQMKQLRRANVVIGTPGRIMDHMRRKTLRIDQVSMVVLDEADEMLSMGFIEDIQTILADTPEERQTVLFSATISASIMRIFKGFLREPQLVDVTTGMPKHSDISQSYYEVPQEQKQLALSLLLQYSGSIRSIVFCNTKAMVDELATSLRAQGLQAAGIHGDMNQSARSQVMERFRKGGVKILVATDVAARGIDVNDIDSVVNYDLPQSFEYYVHRIGRTGRAGRQGISQTLICNKKQLATLRALMRYTGTPIEERKLPTRKELIVRSVDSISEQLLPELQTERGMAASLLVERLLGGDSSQESMEQVALALAHHIMGSDESYRTIDKKAAAQEKKAAAKQAAAAYHDQSRMTSVSVNVGYMDRVTPNHLVCAIADKLNIPGSAIGKIDIGEEKTSIGLRENTAKRLVELDKPIRFHGSPVVFTMQKQKTGTRSPKTAMQRTAKRRKPSGRQSARI